MCAEILMRHCTNLKGKCIGHSTSIKNEAKGIFCHNSSTQSKYTVINLIHTQHKWINSTRTCINRTWRSRLNKHCVMCLECNCTDAWSFYLFWVSSILDWLLHARSVCRVYKLSIIFLYELFCTFYNYGNSIDDWWLTSAVNNNRASLY